ncbi:hypothetical protein ANCCAN_09375 [Ancylostoma caninum]|uniref:CCHC-type domain-containing protein n=1 Tax=Ancylostoma caninum TaxID=29170 RepID=A0A368GNP8_ANCCA|nr:hypothetical protein ANCCAN_09375 [Ancylostoma caninum]
MTIEDEGIEPDFELDRGKTVGKKNAVNIKSIRLHNDRSSSGEKGPLDNGGEEVLRRNANGLPLEILMAKKELKRKLALESGQNASPEETGVPKKKKKCFTELSVGALQSTTPVVTQRKKKKLLKKKLMEGVAVEEVAQKSLKELIKLKPDDPQSASVDVANASIKPKKKKKEVAPVRLCKKEDSAPNPPQNSGKYKELLERLSSVKKEGEARQMITAEVAAGKLEESEIMTVLRMWRQQKRRKMQEENREKLTQMDGTLEELKKTVNDLVRKGKLRGKDAGDIIKRWKMREKRRVDRQVAKQTNRACFHCRQQGHVLADCPNRGEDDQTVGNMATTHGDGICFKCGSTEHNVHKCPRKHVKGKKIFN